jgi:hypothetical protein
LGAAGAAPALPVRLLVFFTIFTAAFCGAAFCALTASHLFFVASTMRLRPAALNFRFGFTGSLFALWYSAHRFF